MRVREVIQTHRMAGFCSVKLINTKGFAENIPTVEQPSGYKNLQEKREGQQKAGENKRSIQLPESTTAVPIIQGH